MIKDDVTRLDHSVDGLAVIVERISQGQEIDANRKLDKQHQAIVEWLSSLDFASKQADIISRRVRGTGGWLLECQEFLEWRKGTSQIVWCPGIRMAFS